MRALSSICVFCGASPGARPVYQEAAQALGQELAQRGLGLVYGGGTVGLMGMLARTVAAQGGRVTGVIPQALSAQALSGGKIGVLVTVDTMHSRKAQMAALADAFVALPGGYGTLDELFEAVTWAQIGYHAKPIGLLNTAGFFDPLLAMVDHGIAEGFIRPAFRNLLLVSQEPAALLDRLADHEMPASLLAGLQMSDL